MARFLALAALALTTLISFVTAVPVASQDNTVKPRHATSDDDYEVEVMTQTLTSMRTIYKSKSALPSLSTSNMVTTTVMLSGQPVTIMHTQVPKPTSSPEFHTIGSNTQLLKTTITMTSDITAFVVHPPTPAVNLIGFPIAHIGDSILFNDPFHPNNVVVGAQTLKPGGPATNVAGALVSVGFGNSIVIGPATIPFLGLPVPTAASLSFGLGAPPLVKPTTISIPTGAPSSILSFSTLPTSGLQVSTVTVNVPVTVTATSVAQPAPTTPIPIPASSSSSSSSFPTTTYSSSSTPSSVLVTSPSSTTIYISTPATRSSTTSSAAAPSSSSASTNTCNAGGETFTTGQEYRDATGQIYIVNCGADNTQPAYSVFGVSTGGFKRCFDACDAAPQCAGWTFSGAESGNCYLKSQEGSYVPASSVVVSGFKKGYKGSIPSQGGSQPTTVSSSMAQSTTSTSMSSSVPSSSTSTSTSSSVAAPSATSSTSSSNCAALAAGGPTYTDKTGIMYNISCKHDIAGSDLTAVSAPTFKDCFPACNARSDCAGFAWLADDGPGTCYLKSSIRGRPSNSNADLAVKFYWDGGVSSSTSSVSSSTTSRTSTSTTTSASAATPTSGCQKIGTSNSFTSQNGQTYTVSCGVDHLGGDLSSASSPSFDGCFDKCDAIDRCVGFAYVGGSGSGTCYFKSSVTAGSTNANVDYAFKAGPSVLTGAVSSSTPTNQRSTVYSTAVVTVYATQQTPSPSPVTSVTVVTVVGFPTPSASPPSSTELRLPSTSVKTSIVTQLSVPTTVYSTYVTQVPVDTTMLTAVGSPVPLFTPPISSTSRFTPSLFYTPQLPSTVSSGGPVAVTGFNYAGGTGRPFGGAKETPSAVRLMDGVSQSVLPYGVESTYNSHFVQIAPNDDGVVIDRMTTVYYTTYTLSQGFVIPTPAPTQPSSTRPYRLSTIVITLTEDENGVRVPGPTPTFRA